MREVGQKCVQCWFKMMIMTFLIVTHVNCVLGQASKYVESKYKMKSTLHIKMQPNFYGVNLKFKLVHCPKTRCRYFYDHVTQ